MNAVAKEKQPVYMKRRLLLFVLLLYAVSAWGQGGVALEARWGDNVHFGQWGSAALTVRHALPRHFQVRGGVGYASWPAAAADLRPSWFMDFDFGRLKLEPMISWLHQSGTDNLCAGLGTGLDLRYGWILLGCYHRTIFAPDSQKLTEPLNLLYEFGGRFPIPDSRWALIASVTNSNLLYVERAYQPTFSLKGLWHPTAGIGMWIAAECKPAGIFNISENYYQSALNFGIEYTW